MSGWYIHTSNLGERPYFEILGVAGRLYLDSLAFGNLHEPFAGGRVAAPTPHVARSPLTLFPEKGIAESALFFQSLGNLTPELLQKRKNWMCAVSAETYMDNSPTRRAVYHLWGCDLSKFSPRRPERNVEIKFRFHISVGRFMMRVR